MGEMLFSDPGDGALSVSNIDVLSLPPTFIISAGSDIILLFPFSIVAISLATSAPLAEALAVSAVKKDMLKSSSFAGLYGFCLAALLVYAPSSTASSSVTKSNVTVYSSSMLDE